MAQQLHEYRKLKDSVLAQAQLLDLNSLPGVFDDVRQERRELSLYLNRKGYLVHVSIGDADPPDRLFERARAGRLSGIRCIRFFPEAAEFPRGRDTLEMTRRSLDLLLALFPDHTAALLVPGPILTPAPAVWAGLIAEEACALDLHAFLTDVDRAMPEDRRQSLSKPAADRVLLIGITQLENGQEAGNDPDELARLARSGGFEPAALIQQRLQKINSRYYLGKGKVQEARDVILDQGLDGVILGEEVKYSQKRNLKKTFGVPVIDRTDLVLEIFSRYATTAEGRLQVKIALINQHIRQMVKEGKFLDQQTGGGRAAGKGAMRGPGETSTQMKRRLIYQRKQDLEERLEKLQAKRQHRRRLRNESMLLRCALVGYTNAGKSSLLRAFSGSEDIEVADRLFTTLETRTRRCKVGEGAEALLSDTVGFIRNLPHHLVEAFRSTLEEALDADLLLIVVDAAGELREEQLKTVQEVLVELKAGLIPQKLIFNKIDLAPLELRWQLQQQYSGSFQVSAATGEGLPALRDWLAREALSRSVIWEMRLPYPQASLLERLYREGQVFELAYLDSGIQVTSRVPNHLQKLFQPYRK